MGESTGSGGPGFPWGSHDITVNFTTPNFSTLAIAVGMTEAHRPFAERCPDDISIVQVKRRNTAR